MRHRGPIPLVALAAWAAATTACLAVALAAPARDLRHPAVTCSAAVTVGWMLIAWAAMTRRPDRLARCLWTLGLAALAAHLVLAFWLAHGWSHAAAVEHVREVGGSGAGIVVNYLFAVLWAADVVWWWAAPAGHARRPWWVGVLLHGFLAFVVVNATVVFGPPERRAAYSVALGLVAALALERSARPSGTR
jgi:hypothetical protein